MSSKTLLLILSIELVFGTIFLTNKYFKYKADVQIAKIKQQTELTRYKAIASMQYVTPEGHRIFLLGGNWLKGTSNRPPTWPLTLAPPYR